VRNFLDDACKFIEGKIDSSIKHSTHPDIRRSSQNKWQTQLQMFAETISQSEDGPLPRQPPNSWNNKVIMVNDPESFPKFSGKSKTKQNPTKSQKEPAREVSQKSQEDLETRLKEIEDRMNKKMEEKMEMMEKKYRELEEKLNMTLEAMEKMSQGFERYEERVLVTVEKQIEEGNARQSAELRIQLEEMYRALSKTMDETIEGIRSEIGEPKKRSKGGK
jgi:exonuclease VII large subunit